MNFVTVLYWMYSPASEGLVLKDDRTKHGTIEQNMALHLRKLATVRNDTVLAGRAALRSNCLDSFHYFHTIGD